MSKPSPGPGPSQRQLRAAELVRHALAEALQRETFGEAALDGGLVTIPEVRLTPDLKHATVYVMPLGGRQIPATLSALNRHKKFLRGYVAKKVAMKYTPDLHFREDETFAEGDRIGRILASPEVARDTRAPKSKPGESEGGA
jgi:ribosome-binding factor A